MLTIEARRPLIGDVQPVSPLLVLEELPLRAGAQSRDFRRAADDLQWPLFYSLARGALDEAETRGIPAGYSPALLAGLFVGLAILSRALPSGLDLVVFLMPLVLVPVQRTVNRINHDIDPALRKAGGFSGKEIALAVPGSLLVLLALIGTMLG